MGKEEPRYRAYRYGCDQYVYLNCTNKLNNKDTVQCDRRCRVIALEGSNGPAPLPV